MMPLAMVTPGETVKLVAIHGGQRIRQRLADLGLTPGTNPAGGADKRLGPTHRGFQGRCTTGAGPRHGAQNRGRAVGFVSTKPHK